MQICTGYREVVSYWKIPHGDLSVFSVDNKIPVNQSDILETCILKTFVAFFAGCHQASSSKSRGSGKLWLQDVYFYHVYSSLDHDSHCYCLGNKEELHQVYRRLQGTCQIRVQIFWLQNLTGNIMPGNF